MAEDEQRIREELRDAALNLLVAHLPADRREAAKASVRALLDQEHERADRHRRLTPAQKKLIPCGWPGCKELVMRADFEAHRATHFAGPPGGGGAR